MSHLLVSPKLSQVAGHFAVEEQGRRDRGMADGDQNHLMKKCRHLADFQITAEATGPNTGIPPWCVLCEDCAAAVVEALRYHMDKLAAPRTVTLADGTERHIARSGKSCAALSF